MPIVKTAQAVKALPSGAVVELLATDAGSIKDVAAWCRATGNELDRADIGRRGLPLRHPPEVRPAMTTQTLDPVDPLAEAIAAVDGWPEVAETDRRRPRPRPRRRARSATKDLLIIDYSGDLEKVWATMILASTSAAMGVKTRVFVTFWGLQVFVKDSKRITGENWMQKMLSAMQRPGISHRKLSKMNFLGMGPWMMGRLAKQYGVASPKELLEAAQAMGVEFIPCQMTMDMFGLKPEDMIEGMGEPAGAATVIGLMTDELHSAVHLRNAPRIVTP